MPAYVGSSLRKYGQGIPARYYMHYPPFQTLFIVVLCAHMRSVFRCSSTSGRLGIADHLWYRDTNWGISKQQYNKY